jgi:hypothetical protein
MFELLGAIPLRRASAIGMVLIVSLRLPPGFITEIDDWAKQTDTSRSAAISALVERGLQSE